MNIVLGSTRQSHLRTALPANSGPIVATDVIGHSSLNEQNDGRFSPLRIPLTRLWSFRVLRKSNKVVSTKCDVSSNRNLLGS